MVRWSRGRYHPSRGRRDSASAPAPRGCSDRTSNLRGEIPRPRGANTDRVVWRELRAHVASIFAGGGIYCCPPQTVIPGKQGSRPDRDQSRLSSWNFPGPSPAAPGGPHKPPGCVENSDLGGARVGYRNPTVGETRRSRYLRELIVARAVHHPDHDLEGVHDLPSLPRRPDVAAVHDDFHAGAVPY